MSATSSLRKFRSRSRFTSGGRGTTTSRANLPVVGEVSTLGLIGGVAVLFVLFLMVSGGNGQEAAPRVNIN